MSLALPTMGEETKPVSKVLITNARISDGTGDALSAPMSVLVVGDKIAQLDASIDTPDGATVIDARGRRASSHSNRP